MRLTLRLDLGPPASHPRQKTAAENLAPAVAVDEAARAAVATVVDQQTKALEGSWGRRKAVDSSPKIGIFEDRFDFLAVLHSVQSWKMNLAHFGAFAVVVVAFELVAVDFPLGQAVMRDDEKVKTQERKANSLVCRQ